ncbi:MAG: RcnB family protein [Rhodoferax sp.]|nr:RcnB family protein [Rhodoferax sp.]
MKSKAVMAAIAAMSMTFAGVALAQGSDPQSGARNGDHRQGGEQIRRGGMGQPGSNAQGGDHRQGGEQIRRGGMGPQSIPNNERGAGPDHNFRRGGRLPNEYRNHQYVVDDWRDHHLSAPPRGYQWVQTGGDYVLVAIATGIIAQILLGQ